MATSFFTQDFNSRVSRVEEIISKADTTSTFGSEFFNFIC